MADLLFEPATSPEQFALLEHLADTIWREHYIPIIGQAQVDYMLGKYQTAAAIASQVAEGMQYRILKQDDTPVGYIAYEPRETALFISKIYVLKDHRGKGIGGQAFRFMEKEARNLNCDRLKLTVNKDNSRSIAAYKKSGFEVVSATVFDIGEGFVMDDFVMEKLLSFD